MTLLVKWLLRASRHSMHFLRFAGGGSEGAAAAAATAGEPEFSSSNLCLINREMHSWHTETPNFCSIRSSIAFIVLPIAYCLLPIAYCLSTKRTEDNIMVCELMMRVLCLYKNERLPEKTGHKMVLAGTLLEFRTTKK